MNTHCACEQTQSRCCRPQVYDDAEVKLNDVVDVVGVLRWGARAMASRAAEPVGKRC